MEKGFFQKRIACHGGKELRWFVLFEEYPPIDDEYRETDIAFCPFCGKRLVRR